jgi:cytochrome c553
VTDGRPDLAESLCPIQRALGTALRGAGRIWFGESPPQQRSLGMKRTLLTVGFCALLGIVGATQAAGDVQAGKAKAGACAGCHGANGEGVKPNPPLAGKSEAETVQALKDYKSGKRNNPIMKTFANPLSDQDMANLAAYYASLKGK